MLDVFQIVAQRVDEELETIMHHKEQAKCTCVLSRPQKPALITFDMAMKIKDCPVHGKNKGDNKCS